MKCNRIPHKTLTFTECALKQFESTKHKDSVGRKYRIPYTYYIAWFDEYGSPKYQYYGSSTRKGCHPYDLMINYKTSCNVVSEIMRTLGDPQVIEIRRVFSSQNEAIRWETNVLKRLRVRTNWNWINSHENDFVYSPEKQRELWRSVYGVDNPSQLSWVQEKIRETSIQKRGVDHHLRDPDVMEKRVNTILEKYGVTSISRVEQVRQLAKDTLLDRYGVDNPSKVPEFQEKKKLTSLKNYGVDHPSRSELVKTRRKETYRRNHPPKPRTPKVDRRYGTRPREYVERTIETNKERYGGGSPMCSESVRQKSKETIIQKYGVLNVSQDEVVKQKKRQTSLERYGVEHTSQLPERRKQYSEAAKARNSIERTCKCCGLTCKGPSFFRHIKRCGNQSKEDYKCLSN